MGATSSANAEKVNTSVKTHASVETELSTATTGESGLISEDAEEGDTAKLVLDESETVMASIGNSSEEVSPSSDSNKHGESLASSLKLEGWNDGEVSGILPCPQITIAHNSLMQPNQSSDGNNLKMETMQPNRSVDGDAFSFISQFDQQYDSISDQQKKQSETTHGGARPKQPQNEFENNIFSLCHLAQFNGDFEKVVGGEDVNGACDEKTKLKKWREAGAVLKDVLNQVGMKMSSRRNSSEDDRKEKEEDPMNLMLQESLGSELLKTEDSSSVSSSVNCTMTGYPTLKNATAAKVLKQVKERTKYSSADGSKNGQFTVKNALALVRAKTSQCSSEGKTSDSPLISDEENVDLALSGLAAEELHNRKRHVLKGSKSDGSILTFPSSIDDLVGGHSTGKMDQSSESSDISRDGLERLDYCKMPLTNGSKIPKVPKIWRNEEVGKLGNPSLDVSKVNDSYYGANSEHGELSPWGYSIPNHGASERSPVNRKTGPISEYQTPPANSELSSQHSRPHRKKRISPKLPERGMSLNIESRADVALPRTVGQDLVSSFPRPHVFASSSESETESTALLSSYPRSLKSKKEAKQKLREKPTSHYHSRNWEPSLYNQVSEECKDSSGLSSNHIPSNSHSSPSGNPWTGIVYQDWCLDDVPLLMTDSSSSAFSDREVPELIDISSEGGSVSGSSSALSMPALTDNSFESDISSAYKQCAGDLSGRISPPPLVCSDSSSTDESTLHAAGFYNRPLEGSSSSDSTDNDADDEFECDCASCRFARTHRDRQWLTMDNETEDEYSWNVLSETRGTELDEDLDPGIPVEMPSPLEWLLFGQTVRRDILEAMFQNVILQMLSVHPDLLTNTAPPPADEHTISNLPQVEINQDHIENESQCPICLNNYNCREKASQLPCMHLFHPLCIQAWLIKSGTCPVCRHVL